MVFNAICSRFLLAGLGAVAQALAIEKHACTVIFVNAHAHSSSEERYFCFGKSGEGILTVRFTYRNSTIRIFGAGYWRKGKAIYERENKVHR